MVNFFSARVTESKQFTLVNFHAITKSMQPETEIKYFKFFPEEYPNLNLLFCGDFNVPLYINFLRIALHMNLMLLYAVFYSALIMGNNFSFNFSNSSCVDIPRSTSSFFFFNKIIASSRVNGRLIFSGLISFLEIALSTIVIVM